MQITMESPSGHERAGEIVDESIYLQLQNRARAVLRGESRDHGFEPADLVNESFVRIARSGILPVVKDRGHLIALLTLTMRRVLIDCARGARSLRRSDCVPLDFDTYKVEAPDAYLIRDLLARLAAHDPHLYRIVVMRYVCGFDYTEIATALSMSSRTAKRKWRAARNWLDSEFRTVADTTGQQRLNRNRVGRRPRPLQERA